MAASWLPTKEPIWQIEEEQTQAAAKMVAAVATVEAADDYTPAKTAKKRFLICLT
jgi:hypothetical protein